MSGPDLAAPCPHDGRPFGEHTLAEWWDEVHSAASVDVPYEDVPGGPVTVSLSDDDHRALSDTVVVRSSVVTIDSNGMPVVLPALLFEFQIGSMTGPPTTVQTAALIMDTEQMRKIGVIFRDAANAAANAAERAR